MINNDNKSIKLKIHDIIFEADTKLGKIFDEILLISIILSVGVVMLESVKEISLNYKKYLVAAEWFFTIIFSIEYLLRIWTTKKSKTYIFSLYGVIDLLSVLPTYISLFLVGTHYLMIIRILRLLRVFRVLKLIKFLGASRNLLQSLNNSRHKIAVFFFFIVLIVTIMGSVMYIVESPETGFTSIPRSVYWAIVTLTTVGYGDIAPQTMLGQSIASVIMLLGYAIIAVPTGIITSEMFNPNKKEIPTNTQVCCRCNFENHADDANYCKICGEPL